MLLGEYLFDKKCSLKKDLFLINKTLLSVFRLSGKKIAIEILTRK